MRNAVWRPGQHYLVGCDWREVWGEMQNVQEEVEKRSWVWPEIEAPVYEESWPL